MYVGKKIEAQPIKKILINLFLTGLILKSKYIFFSPELTYLTIKITNTKIRRICNCMNKRFIKKPVALVLLHCCSLRD